MAQDALAAQVAARSSAKRSPSSTVIVTGSGSGGPGRRELEHAPAAAPAATSRTAAARRGPAAGPGHAGAREVGLAG